MFRALMRLRATGALARSSRDARRFVSSKTPSHALPAASVGLDAVIARKNVVATEFSELRRETEDLAIGLEKLTAGDLLLQKTLDQRGHWLWVDVNSSALEAVQRMTRANVGALLVMRERVLDVDDDGVVTREEASSGKWDDAVAGVVTERDYLHKIVAKHGDASTTKVGDVMTAKDEINVASVDTPVLEAMRAMIEGRHRHLPVMNKDRTMAGMLCMGDVTRMVLDEHRKEVVRLRDYMTGGY
ncbi:uncharacterized protein MICPUCDRAFT_68400 [Micromonas pusilla CCMP1545]|uniref:Predicted protein n=1 Tax=Micromonas pusilla (strain CCMP1545) TaxID=564608 RepID=C1MSA7_MICPC|nr:uncharacterized protein MICPUCDRAFT_68400 [Micromonas pusilla CCMP1545]EEH57473.1 predicted protein [Micromonas pusilla CCMP1545]|mmetsp:Transcript_12942/g.46531  ORF Transcript_12942/g.46531 Transcript_12942/m.46531 type:complete len:244 (-) Transcript_12942:197-928(-)|eukprot:XP_003059018.1 predicted protein [Micromonas pusilla CCMP1545]